MPLPHEEAPRVKSFFRDAHTARAFSLFPLAISAHKSSLLIQRDVRVTPSRASHIDASSSLAYTNTSAFECLKSSACRCIRNLASCALRSDV